MSDKRILTVEEMLAADDIEYKELAAWNGTVRVASLTAAGMIDWLDENPKGPAGIRLLVKSLVDGEGERIGKPEHVAAFAKKDAKVTGRLVNAVLELNGMIARDKTAEILKNVLGEVLTDASPTN